MHSKGLTETDKYSCDRRFGRGTPDEHKVTPSDTDTTPRTPTAPQSPMKDRSVRVTVRVTLDEISQLRFRVLCLTSSERTSRNLRAMASNLLAMASNLRERERERDKVLHLIHSKLMWCADAKHILCG